MPPDPLAGSTLGAHGIRQLCATSMFPIMHLICPRKCFQFLLGRLQYPGEMKNKGYAKFWWTHKVHYGKCGSGELKNILILRAQKVGQSAGISWLHMLKSGGQVQAVEHKSCS